MVRRFFCLMLFSLSAGGKPLPCPNLIQELSETPFEELGLLLLPAYSERYLVASQIVDADGEPYLGLAGYGSEHSVIHSAFEGLVSAGKLKELEYEMLGEIKLVNSSAVPARGTVVEICETAGYFHSQLKPTGKGGNDLRKLIAHLKAADALHNSVPKESRPRRLIAPPAFRLKIPWERSEATGHFHLMPGLDTFIGALEKLKQMELVPPHENYRHFIRNKVQGLFLQMGMYVELEQTQHLERLFQYQLGKESLQLYLRWLKDDGISTPATEGVSGMLETLMARPLTIDEWIRFESLSEDFLDVAVDWQDRANQVKRVQIFHLKR